MNGVLDSLGSWPALVLMMALGLAAAIAVYVLAQRTEPRCSCPRYMLRRQSGVGRILRVFHLPSCEVTK